MKIYKKILLTILPLILVIIIDQVTKQWAKTLLSPLQWGVFEFKLIYNNGIILGHFSDLPQRAKETAFITFGAFTLVCYFFFTFLVPIKSRFIYLGSSILVGGIIGNVIDRFSGIGVVDFISIFNLNNSPIFNLADMLQWFGYIFLGIGFYQDARYFWPKIELRDKFLINPRFQFRASILVSALIFLTSNLMLTFAYSFLRADQNEIVLEYFFIVGILISITLSMISFFVTIIITHRVAGPILAIQRHIKATLEGKSAHFNLRENDEFKELEEDMNSLNKKLLQDPGNDV